MFEEGILGEQLLETLLREEVVVQAVLFLSDNEKAGYITGVTLKIDGGLVLPGMPETPGVDKWVYEKNEITWDDSDL